MLVPGYAGCYGRIDWFFNDMLNTVSQMRCDWLRIPFVKQKGSALPVLIYWKFQRLYHMRSQISTNRWIPVCYLFCDHNCSLGAGAVYILSVYINKVWLQHVKIIKKTQTLKSFCFNIPKISPLIFYYRFWIQPARLQILRLQSQK